MLLALLPFAQPASAADPVKIGELNSYAGVPAFTVPYRNGWQLAVDEINKAGGVLGGRPLEVISHDDGGKAASAVATAAELVEHDDVTILAGTLLSHVGLAVAGFAKEKKVIFLAAQPMSDALVWSQGNRYTFRLRSSYSMQAAMLAEQAAKLPAKRWATVAPDYEYGRSLVADFEQALKERRPDVEFVAEQWPPLGRLEATPLVDALTQAKPEAVFNATFAGDLSRLVQEIRRHGSLKKAAVVSALTGEPEYLDVLGGDAPEGWIVSGYPWYGITTSDHKKFVDAYMAAYGEDPRMASLIGYDMVKAIAAAVEKAGNTDPDDLAAAFEGLTFATPTGPLSFRMADHQATLGAWIGKTAQRDGTAEMIDWIYDDGAAYLPPADDAHKRRPSQ